MSLSNRPAQETEQQTRRELIASAALDHAETILQSPTPITPTHEEWTSRRLANLIWTGDDAAHSAIFWQAVRSQYFGLLSEVMATIWPMTATAVIDELDHEIAVAAKAEPCKNRNPIKPGKN